GVNGFQAGKGVVQPFPIYKVPIQGSQRVGTFYPFPTFGVPVPEIAVPTVVDEIQILLVSYEGAGNFKRLEQHFVGSKFVIETESSTFMDDFINPFWYPDKVGRRGRECIVLIFGGCLVGGE